MDRPGWDQFLEYARPGDTFRERVKPHDALFDGTAKVSEQRQINLVSLRENIDTTTATGPCFLSMMGAIHQMERELRAERTAAGRSLAKAQGKIREDLKLTLKN